jgi:hypothetical protein
MTKPGTISLISLCITIFLSACTHMDGVVKDIKLA